jgi:hypothetical protein
MAIELDGFTVLRSIGTHAGTFPSIAVEAKKAAHSLVVKQLKAKTASLKATRAVREAIGHDMFAFLIDAMKDSEVKTVLGKLDKHHPEIKAANAAWRRQQLRALADGSAEPTEKPKPQPKAKGVRKTKPKPQEPDLLSSKAMAAVRKRFD